VLSQPESRDGSNPTTLPEGFRRGIRVKACFAQPDLGMIISTNSDPQAAACTHDECAEMCDMLGGSHCNPLRPFTVLPDLSR